MNTVRLLIAVAAVCVGMYLAQSVSHKSNPPPQLEQPSQPPIVPVRRFYPFHGMSVQLASSWKVLERYGTLVKEVADLGADTVMFSVDTYQEHAGSPEVKIDPVRIPSKEEFLAILRIAKEANLRVILMPKVLLADPRGNEWRGVIQPNNWDQWFASYREFVDFVAEVAEQGQVAAMMVGSELVSTEKYTEKWTEIIARVRSRYHGLLGYSANWDHYKNIEFWKDLDLVGLTTYHKLADKPCPSVEELVEAWKPIKQEILDWQATVGKPLVFTEVGWCSQEGSAEFPWNYYNKQEATPDGHKEQLHTYLAFMKAWGDVKQIGGILWWEWTESPGGDSDFNYTPKGKPAQKALQEWFKQVRARPSSPATGPAEGQESEGNLTKRERP